MMQTLASKHSSSYRDRIVQTAVDEWAAMFKRLPNLMHRHGVALTLDYLRPNDGVGVHEVVNRIFKLTPDLAGWGLGNDAAAMVALVNDCDTETYAGIALMILQRAEALQMMAKVSTSTDTKREHRPDRPARSRAAINAMPGPVGNPGWRFCHQPPGYDGTRNAQFFNDLAANSTAPAEISPLVAHYTSDLKAQGLSVMKVTSKLRIFPGMGEDSVLGQSLRMDPVWGVPMINGESIKGMARAAAILILDSTPDLIDQTWIDAAFGTEKSAGLAVFADAIWCGPAGGLPFVVETVGPGEASYHDSLGGTLPTLFEAQTPVALLSAQGDFLVGYGLSDSARTELQQDPEAESAALDYLKQLLLVACDQLGVGSKVNVDSYGALRLSDD